jgi:hypothetical protein
MNILKSFKDNFIRNKKLTNFFLKLQKNDSGVYRAKQKKLQTYRKNLFKVVSLSRKSFFLKLIVSKNISSLKLGQHFTQNNLFIFIVGYNVMTNFVDLAQFVQLRLISFFPRELT